MYGIYRVEEWSCCPGDGVSEKLYCTFDYRSDAEGYLERRYESDNLLDDEYEYEIRDLGDVEHNPDSYRCC